MTGTHQALYNFFSQMSIPAYFADAVPDDAVFPYLTFQVVDGEAFTSSIVNAFVWVKKENGISSTATVAALLDEAAALLPEGGVRLALDSGFDMIYRNGADFTAYLQDEQDPTVLGGRISCELRFYHA